jgi:hypothetical protein
VKLDAEYIRENVKNREKMNRKRRYVSFIVQNITIFAI